MIIEKLPNYEEVIRILTEEGTMSFIIDRKHKKRFYNLIERSKKLENLFQSKRTLLNRIKINIFGAYVILLQTFLTASSKNLHNAVTIYQVAWRYIASIGGEDLPNKKTKVTYYGRT